MLPLNREGLSIEVDFSLLSERGIRALDRIIEWRVGQTVRYDWLAQDLFDTFEQMQDCATRWL